MGSHGGRKGILCPLAMSLGIKLDKPEELIKSTKSYKGIYLLLAEICLIKFGQ